MPYCSKCRDEFQEWVKVCPDCRVKLVAELPPKPKKIRRPDEPLVHIATAPNEPIANIWSAALADNDIRCLLKSGHLKAAGYTPSAGPIAIHVLSSQVKKAQKILAPLLKD